MDTAASDSRCSHAEVAVAQSRKPRQKALMMGKAQKSPGRQVSCPHGESPRRPEGVPSRTCAQAAATKLQSRLPWMPPKSSGCISHPIYLRDRNLPQFACYGNRLMPQAFRICPMMDSALLAFEAACIPYWQCLRYRPAGSRGRCQAQRALAGRARWTEPAKFRPHCPPEAPASLHWSPIPRSALSHSLLEMAKILQLYRCAGSLSWQSRPDPHG